MLNTISKMEKLKLRSRERINRVSTRYRRDELYGIDWDQRLLGITGSRGVGKTTLVLQHIRERHGLGNEALYLSLDDLYFTEHRLLDLAEDFRREGGLFVYLDEVHKYPGWANEVKTLYDLYPDLNIVFTGSSMLELYKANADLSRRAVMYQLHGLTFRQYLGIKDLLHHDPVPLADVLHRGNELIMNLPEDFRPYPHFRNYLKMGYLPFFLESESWYSDLLQASTRALVESDMALIYNIDVRNLRSIYQLLYAVATSPPFKPNIVKISERLEISRNTVVQYLHYLEKADLLVLLGSSKSGLSSMQKPDKIYFSNPNLYYALHPGEPNTGAVRESFVLSQLRRGHEVRYPETGDFLIDDQYLIEVGGKNKSEHQIRDAPHGYIAADDLDYALGRKVPIWLFGWID